MNTYWCKLLTAIIIGLHQKVWPICLVYTTEITELFFCWSNNCSLDNFSGHVDPGESDYETALRETKEESGFDGKAFRVISDFKCELSYTSEGDGKRPKVVKYWGAEMINPNSEVTLSNESQAFKWLPLKEAMQLVGVEKFGKCLENCESKINSL